MTQIPIIISKIYIYKYSADSQLKSQIKSPIFYFKTDDILYFKIMH